MNSAQNNNQLLFGNGSYSFSNFPSNFSLSKCKRNCNLLHPFNINRRATCLRTCDEEYQQYIQQQQQQQQQLNDIINSPVSKISTGTIVAIISGIIVLTVAGIYFIRKKNGK